MPDIPEFETTIEAFREHFLFVLDRFFTNKAANPTQSEKRTAQAIINREMANFDATMMAIRGDAWSDGFIAGWAEATDPEAFVNDVWDAKTPNPFWKRQENE